jgi:hypothetical protein
MSSEVLRGFTEQDAARIESHLDYLVPHLEPDRFTVVGGIAVRYRAQESGLSFPPRQFNDLDIVADNFSVVSPSITNDFLTYHVHQDGDSFFFAFVDPRTRTKVDIFDSTFPVREANYVKIGKNSLKVITAENQLVTLIPTVLLASNDLKRDPKLVDEINLLASISDMRRAQELWEQSGGEGLIQDGIQRVNDFMKENPQFFQEKPYHKPGPYECSSCVDLPEFPIVPMEQVYEVLGYVE